MGALRPEPLERAPFGEALAGVAAKWSALHGILIPTAATPAVVAAQTSEGM